MNTFNTIYNTIQTKAAMIEPSTRGVVDTIANDQDLQDTLGMVLFILLIAMLVVAVMTVSVQKAFMQKNQQFALKQTSAQKTGAQVANEILAKNGITNVKVVSGVEGQDHFNPQTNTISLSPSTYNSSSVSAMAIAAHEVGHAIQWHKKSIMVRVRNILQTPVQIAAGVGQMMFAMGGIIMMFIMGFSMWVFWITIAGVITYAAMGIFQLVTLPLEFDASRRAMKNLTEMGFIQTEDERTGAKGVLRAAAMTYVIAFIATLITLAFFLIRLLLILANNRN